jgi:C-terminal processing protease CtpA/Prc
MLRRNTPRYEKIPDPKAFAAAVNADLYAVTHDKHVHVAYPFETNLLKQSQPNQALTHKLEAWSDYEFREVRRLPGNIGYIAFDGFSGDPDLGSVIHGAMQFVGNTDALIIDLRQNGGGSPRAAETFESYFFHDQKQITSLMVRDPKTGKVSEIQQYTASTVPGPLYLNKPVYLLTSRQTFSCAEQFTYDLHNLKRVTIVGETTGGGANPGAFHAIASQFAIFIPDGRAWSPVTKTNWEGTGIAPDVATPAKDALLRAYTMALRDERKRETNPDIVDAIKRDLADPAKALAQ